MARRRFFVDDVRGDRAVLRGDDAQHLQRVLRAEPGQRYELSDNESVYLAEIEELGRGEVRFRVVERLPVEEPARRITLFASLIRFERFEWMLEKATELGVQRIVPVAAERSEKGIERAAAKRLKRWRKILKESSQQARRSRMPEIAAPLPLPQALAMAEPVRLFLDRDAPRLTAPPAEADQVAVLIGPEGGWTEQERSAALAAGWNAVSIGLHVLRTETAAIAALAVLMM